MNNPAIITPYYENIDTPKKQTQTTTQNNLPTEVTKPTPSSNINLFSTKIRQFNNYPEFKSNAGINQVIQLLENIETIPVTKKKDFLKSSKTFMFTKMNYFMELLINLIIIILILFYKLFVLTIKIKL